MSEPCVASMPFGRPASHCGAALVLALLALTLVAGIASFVVKDYGAAVSSFSGRQDQAQTRLLARAAVDWARNVLAADAKTSVLDHYSEIWATRVPPTPVEEGEIGGELDDLSGRFDLNGLTRTGGTDSAQVTAYGRLLVELGVPAPQAATVVASLISWSNANAAGAVGVNGTTARDGGIIANARLAGASLVDADELKQVEGYNEELINRLRPFVVALPVAAPLNVNTASPEVLAAVVPDLGIDQARILVAQRQVLPFKDLADFAARLPRGVVMPDKVRFSVAGRYFLASVRARYGQATTRMQVLLDRQKTWPEIVWQKLL
jgi:general secretion pathway protein K